MKKAWPIILVIVFTGYLILYAVITGSPAVDVFSTQKERTIYYVEKEQALYGFIEKNLTGKDGEVYTRLAGDKSDRMTLSESTGLLMNYYVLKDRRDLFEQQYEYLGNNLLGHLRLVKWRSGEDVACNAAIDDFRIARALLDGYEKWGIKKYYDTAGFIQESVYSKLVVDGRLGEFYDWKSNARRDVIPLCYIDLYTMDRLSSFNSRWSETAQYGLRVMKDGRAGNTPLYNKYLDYRTGSYRLDEEYKEAKGISLVYTLYSAIHMAETNQDDWELAGWLKEEMNRSKAKDNGKAKDKKNEKGKLYAWYDPNTLKPVSELESTAVYALAAVYAKKVGEDELYRSLIDRMLDFMVTDKKSPYYGGFGNAKSGTFYSFDNLTALWALSLAGDT